MKTGKVKFYNASKGYGFIVDDETKQEVFVHQTGLTDRINQDDIVTFEVTEGKKGPNAVNVKKMQ
ncbi:MAG: cold shock domain-containing protein [Bacteroidia bacterium]|nr:cold shock domain-containing protein [Bacteroidia bacterium]MCZ2278316.1 cold shock domain-containing protein [Bacteroidia bacterium]